MPDEDQYSPEWEIVNSTLRRLRTPWGWYTVVSERVIHGGIEIHVSSNPLDIYDPHHLWIIKQK